MSKIHLPFGSAGRVLTGSGRQLNENKRKAYLCQKLILIIGTLFMGGETLFVFQCVSVNFIYKNIKPIRSKIF